MPVTDVRKDPRTLTMTITCSFDAPVERVWELWADPRQLERWWGPPTYPATFERHDLSPGGDVTYFMTGPEGDRPRGWWRVTSATPPTQLVFEDGFATADGTPDPDMPVMGMRVDIAPSDGGGSTMAITTGFATVEDMERILSMGMEEGLASALSQIDDVLAG